MTELALTLPRRSPRLFLLLTGIVFVMGMINSWFTPERTLALLAGRTFLIAAPMINEVALTLLFALFGWKIALLYMGLSVAIVAGWVIGRLKMEGYLEDWANCWPAPETASGVSTTRVDPTLAP